MKFVSIFLFISFLLLSKIYAQDYRSGFVILESKDTLRGYIAFRENDQRFNSCIFKGSIEEDAVEFGASQLLGYAINGEALFLRLKLPESDPANKISFSEVLFNGRVSLLKSYFDFYIQKGNNIARLGSKEKNRGYISTLKNYLSDCPEIKVEIENSEISDYSLLQLLNRYTQCISGNTQIFNINKPKFKFVVGPIVGVSDKTLKGYATTAKFINVNQFSKSTSPFAGISLEASSPRRSDYWFANIDLLWGAYSFKSLRIQPNEVFVVIFDYEAIFLPVSIGYRIPLIRNSVKAIFEMGGTMQFISVKENFMQTEIGTGNRIDIDRKQPFVPLRSAFTPFLSVGLSKSIGKKITLKLKGRFEHGGFIVSNDNLLQSTASINISAAYQLTR